MSGGLVRPGFIMVRILDGEREKELVARLWSISIGAETRKASNFFQLADYITYTNSNAERIRLMVEEFQDDRRPKTPSQWLQVSGTDGAQP